MGSVKPFFHLSMRLRCRRIRIFSPFHAAPLSPHQESTESGVGLWIVDGQVGVAFGADAALGFSTSEACCYLIAGGMRFLDCQRLN
jgi:hypothetical protein